MDGAKEAYPTSFFIVVDIWFVANHLKTNIAVKVFLQSDDSKDLGAFYFFGLLEHFLIDLIDRQIRRVQVQCLILRVKQPKLTFDSLMSGHDIESYLILDGSFVQSDNIQVDYYLPALLEISWRAGYSSLHEVRLQMIHQHCYPIALPSHLDRFSEHLHRFYLAFLLNLA